MISKYEKDEKNALAAARNNEQAIRDFNDEKIEALDRKKSQKSIIHGLQDNATLTKWKNKHPTSGSINTAEEYGKRSC